MGGRGGAIMPPLDLGNNHINNRGGGDYLLWEKGGAIMPPLDLGNNHISNRGISTMGGRVEGGNHAAPGSR